MKVFFLFFVLSSFNSLSQQKDSSFCVFPEKQAQMIDVEKNGYWFTEHCVNNIDSMVCGEIMASKFFLVITIEKNGIVSSAELIQSTEGQDCRLNLCKPLNESPKFIPAEEKGKACHQNMRLPLNIDFN